MSPFREGDLVSIRGQGTSVRVEAVNGASVYLRRDWDGAAFGVPATDCLLRSRPARRGDILVARDSQGRWRAGDFASASDVQFLVDGGYTHDDGVRTPVDFTEVRESNVQREAQMNAPYRYANQRASMLGHSQDAQMQAARAQQYLPPIPREIINGVAYAFAELASLIQKHERWARAFFASDTVIIELVEKRAEMHRDPTACDCGGCVDDHIARRERWQRAMDVAWSIDAFGKRTEYLARTLKALALINGKC